MRPALACARVPRMFGSDCVAGERHIFFPATIGKGAGPFTFVLFYVRCRRGLSQAESARFEALRMEAKTLQHEIWRLEKDDSYSSVP